MVRPKRDRGCPEDQHDFWCIRAQTLRLCASVGDSRAGMPSRNFHPHGHQETRSTRRVPRQAQARASHPSRPAPSTSGGPPGRRSLRRPQARGATPALRSPPRDGRRAPVLGGPQGPLLRHGRQAARGSRRGPPDRVRRLRGTHPGGELRRRSGDRVGSRPMDPEWRITPRDWPRASCSSSCVAGSSTGCGPW